MRLYGPHFHPFDSPIHYHIYDHPSAVPWICYSSPDVVVEKFALELDKGLFCVRNFHFLGDHTFCIRIKSKRPIVNSRTYEFLEEVEPDPEIVAMRRRLKFDFGKFDYVVVDGKAILLDVNKTMGAAGLVGNPRFKQLRRFRAEGLYSFFETARA